VIRGARAQGSLPLFFTATFAVAWACFIPVAAAIPRAGALGWLLVTLGTFAPSLVALALTARDEGQAGVRALLARTIQGGVAARWYLFAVGYTAAVKLCVALLHRAIAGAWPRFGSLPLYLIPFAIAISTPVQAGEEIGWRGYALPRLARRIGLAPASLVLGVIWAVWHLPLFFVRWGDTYGQSFIVFVMQVTALSAAFAWLWARTGRSLLLTMLLHAAVNNSKDIVPSASAIAPGTFGLDVSLVAWLTLAVFWACAAFFLGWMAMTESRRAGTYGD
jgi:CAAX protease family protein